MICITCKKVLDESKFRIYYKGKYGPYYRKECKQCQNKRNRKYKKYSSDRNKRAKLNRKEWLNSIKRPCVICGFDKVYAIQFHHADIKTKNFTIGEKNFSKVKMLEEAKKCYCVCANCHFGIHAGEILIPQNAPLGPKPY